MEKESAMHWKVLEKEIINSAQGYKDSCYFKALEQLKWDGSKQTISRNIGILCEFIEKCESQTGRIDKQKLLDVWLEIVEPLADCVEDVCLERHGMLKAVDRKEYGIQCVGQAIQRMYDELQGVPFIGRTEASRLLHLRFPKLFLMIDEQTIKYWLYDVRLHRLFGMRESELFDGYGYTFIYLPFIKSHAVDAIMSYASDKALAINEAIAQLKNLGGKTRSIARLMDEYYYAITRG